MRRGLLIIAAIVFMVAGGAALGIARQSTDTEPADDVMGSVVMLGDSITAQGSWSRLFPDRFVVNAGYPGFTSEQLIPIAAEVAKSQPAAVFVLAGINDIFFGQPPDSIAVNLLEIVAAVESEAPDAEVVIQTLLPNAGRSDEVLATNAVIRAAAAEFGVEILDLYPAFDDGSGALRPAETYDGVHLAEPGYERWAALLEPRFERLGSRPESG